MPIDYDDYLDVLFLYWVKYPIAYEHYDLFYILGISQLLMIYIYDFFCWVWTLKHMIDDMLCVEQEVLVDVFVTVECIHPYILSIVPQCLFWDVFVMYLSHVLPRCS